MDGYGYSLEPSVYNDYDYDYIQSFWKSGPCPSALNMLLAHRFWDLALDLAVIDFLVKSCLRLLEINEVIHSPNHRTQICQMHAFACKRFQLVCCQVRWEPEAFRPSLKPKMLLGHDDSVKPKAVQNRSSCQTLIATYLVRSRLCCPALPGMTLTDINVDISPIDLVNAFGLPLHVLDTADVNQIQDPACKTNSPTLECFPACPWGKRRTYAQSIALHQRFFPPLWKALVIIATTLLAAGLVKCGSNTNCCKLHGLFESQGKDIYIYMHLPPVKIYSLAQASGYGRIQLVEASIKYAMNPSTTNFQFLSAEFIEQNQYQNTSQKNLLTGK